MTRYIPFHRPSIDRSDIAAVVKILRSGWLTTGRVAHAFESAFKQEVGARHAIAVCSGTAALHLALEAVGVRRGDEVIVPTMTFAATAEVVAYLGARPVLVDCRPDTFNMCVKSLSRKITQRTRAILPVHMAGQPCEMDHICKIARRNGIAVVDDAAHCGPAAYQGRQIGTWGDATAFSFYATKNITTGEGGMVVTNRSRLAERMRLMSLHGISKDAWKRYTAEGTWYYEIIQPGFKYNMSDIQAALGLSQLRRSKTFFERRRAIAQRYTDAFADCPEVITPTVLRHAEHAWHLYILQLVTEKMSIGRNEFIEQLKKRGIGTSVHFIPLHMHPYYRKTYGYAPEDFPNALQVYRRSISLPLYPALRDGEVQRVIEVVKEVIAQYRKRRFA